MNPLLSREPRLVLARVLSDARRGEAFAAVILATGRRVVLVAHRDLRRGETVAA